jgi:hypothetical protein
MGCMPENGRRGQAGAVCAVSRGVLLKPEWIAGRMVGTGDSYGGVGHDLMRDGGV